jgi:hypothetical protein
MYTELRLENMEANANDILVFTSGHYFVCQQFELTEHWTASERSQWQWECFSVVQLSVSILYTKQLSSV